MMINIPENHVDQYMRIFKNKDIQLDILQEECAELIKAISKYKRAIGHYTVIDPIDNVIEEMTHVAISSEIVARLLDIKPEDIQREVDRKATKFHLRKGENDD